MEEEEVKSDSQFYIFIEDGDRDKLLDFSGDSTLKSWIKQFFLSNYGLTVNDSDFDDIYVDEVLANMAQHGFFLSDGGRVYSTIFIAGIQSIIAKRKAVKEKLDHFKVAKAIEEMRS